MSRDIKGVIPMMVTPFGSDGEVDTERLKAFTEYLVENGIHGVSMGGSTGEFVHLSGKERILVFKKVIEAAKGRVLTIPGVGALTTKDGIWFAKEAEDMGADAVLLPPPFYFPIVREELNRYFTDVAKSIEIPVILYNAPITTGIDLDAHLIGKLSDETQNIRYVKESTQDISMIQKVVRLGGKRMKAIAGLEHLILPMLVVGCRGIMVASASIVPREMVSMWNHFEKGEAGEASRIFRKLLPLFDEITGDPNRMQFVQSNKAALNMLGVEVGGPRKPLLPLVKADAERLRKTLEAVLGRELPKL